ncbi:MAG: hypothetical protein K2G78_00970 [Muribaculaceae bacterium]|nr:hypothetical protein [Muribaculaceae bacterium]
MTRINCIAGHASPQEAVAPKDAPEDTSEDAPEDAPDADVQPKSTGVHSAG